MKFSYTTKTMTSEFESSHLGHFLLCFRTEVSKLFPVKGQRVTLLGFAGHTVLLQSFNSAVEVQKQTQTISNEMDKAMFQ